MLNGKYAIPSLEEFYNQIDLNRIYDIECSLKDKKMVSVLNTFIFHLVEYKPQTVIENLKDFETYEPKKKRK